MRKLALATLLCFGCATLRVPVSTPTEPADARGTVAPPILELWLESSGPVAAGEQAQSERQARAALDAALLRHPVAPDALGARDAVLFVRERGVALTEARRSQQRWAKVGIVVGIVVVVAVVVIAVVAGKDSHPRSAAKPAAPARPAPAAVAVKPRAEPIGSGGRPIARPIGPPAAPAPLPPPRVYVYGYAPSPLFFDLQLLYLPRPLVLRDDERDPAEQPWPGAPPPPEDDAAEAQPETPPGPALTLPPLLPVADFAVEERGFFSGTHASLQLDLLDRTTSAVLWSRAVAGDADPLDAGDVSNLLDEALKDAAWARRAR